jgi:hypothetical protein
MPAKKQLQFRADIKANRKPWYSKVEFTMPGALKLYRDYELAGEPEYASAAGKKGGKMDALPETKERNNYARDPKNKDGLVSKWQQGGKIDAKPETKERLNYALNPKNKDGYDSKWQRSSRMAMAATRTNCITCKRVPRNHMSDKCNQCQLAVFAM